VTLVDAVRIVLQVLLVVSSLVLTLFILLHKGKGGGLSDMFGGGMSTSLGGSSVAERNLDRFTIAIAVIWGAAIVGLGLLGRFAS
jgi:preprotein translocase subunit SecG